MLRHLGRTAEAETTLALALSLAPDDTNCLTEHGILLGVTGRREEAEACFVRALALGTDAPSAHYDHACMCALTGDTDGALASLEAAVVAGHPDLAWARLDPDLEALHGTPQFEALIRRTQPTRS